MIILAIETSCDETAIAIIKDGTIILANDIFSQIKTHQPYGGVVPELASRMHAEKIHYLIDRALDSASLAFKDIDACAVTYGPGLEGSLLVGLSVAKAMSKLLSIPLIGVNHLHGHLYAHYLGDTHPSFPYIGLIVSGGHTQLVLVKDHFDITLLGETRDDAAGEAFDKVARYLGLGYPGGPLVEEAAKTGSETAFSFPRGMKNKPFEFSFSGLKTAVIQATNTLPKDTLPIHDICASFQAAVRDTLITKSFEACHVHNCSQLVLSGGVMANQSLLTAFRKEASDKHRTLFTVDPILCTDNAAMIGAAAFYQYQNQIRVDIPLKATPNLTL